MTGKWCGWAAELPMDIKGNPRVAAFVLGDASDPSGLVTYGKTKLAKRGGMSIRSWQRACDVLEAYGWVTKHENAVESIKTRDGKTIHLKGNKRPNLYVLNTTPLPENERRLTPTLIDERKKAWVDTSDTPVEPISDSTRGATDDIPGGVKSGNETPVRGVTSVHQSPPYPPTEGTPPLSPCGFESDQSTQDPASSRSLAEPEQLDLVANEGGTADKPSSETRRLCKRFAELRMIDPQAIDPKVKRRDWIAAMTALVNYRSVRSVEDMLDWLQVDDRDKFWTAKADCPKKLAMIWDQIEVARTQKSDQQRLRTASGGNQGRGPATEESKILSHAMADAALALEGA